MELTGTRFGSIEFDERRALDFPRGLIGFEGEKRFIFLEPAPGRLVAWLQSLGTPELAFPVVAGVVFGSSYPTPGVGELARNAGLSNGAEGNFIVLVIVAAHPKRGRIANLLAPIVVNVDTRIGAQVVLNPEVYSASAPFAAEPPSLGAALAGARASHTCVLPIHAVRFK